MSYIAEQLAGFEDLEHCLLSAMTTLGETRVDFGGFTAHLAARNTLMIINERQASFLDRYGEVRPLPSGFDEFFELFAEAMRIAVHWF